MIDQFSYLNITSIGRNLIQEENDCGYACLEIPSCFSYNVAAFPDVNNKRLCELLPSDKFNNSDKFNASEEFHHFFISVSQTSKWSKVFRSITLSLPNVAKRDKNFQISLCKMLKKRIAQCESTGREVHLNGNFTEFCPQVTKLHHSLWKWESLKNKCSIILSPNRAFQG